MKKIIIIGIVLCMFMIGGCVKEAAICEKPYIDSGAGCCLDSNNDGICDSEQTLEEMKCPASCDDGNKCTEDVCSESTDFKCVHNLISPCPEDKEELITPVVSEEPTGEPGAELSAIRLDGEGYLRFGYKFNLIQFSVKNTGETDIVQPTIELITTETLLTKKTRVISESRKKLDITIEKGRTIELIEQIPELLMTAAEHETNEYEFDIAINLKDKSNILSTATKKFMITRDLVLKKSTIDNPAIELVNDDKIKIDDVLYVSDKNTAQINTIVISVDEDILQNINKPVIDVFIEGHGEYLALYNKIGISLVENIPVSFTMLEYADPTDISIYVRLRDGNNPRVVASNKLRVSLGIETSKNKVMLNW